MTERINFARGVPATAAFPYEQIQTCVQALSSKQDKAAFQYGPSLGPSRLREWLAANHNVSVDRVMVGDGSVSLFDLLCRVRLNPGQTVLVEEPCYDRIVHLLRYYRANVVGVPLEKDGPKVDALQVAAKRLPTFLYTVPDFQNPCGVVWSAEKRQHLVSLARQHEFLIVEDSPYRLLRYKGTQLPSLLELGPDVTIQLNSFSKTISPGLRAAYRIADATTVALIAKMAENTYVTPGNFALSVTAEWLQRRYLPDQVSRLKSSMLLDLSQ